MHQLNLPSDPCNPNQDYNFRSCYKVLILSSQIGDMQWWQKWFVLRRLFHVSWVVEQNGIDGCLIKTYLFACRFNSLGLFTSHNQILRSQSNLMIGLARIHLWFFLLRAYERKYLDLMNMELEDIFIQTGCQKPCTYKKYSLSGDKQVTSTFEFITFC